MQTHQVRKGKQLSEIFNIPKEDIDKNFHVTIEIENDTYDETHDPDWIMRTKEDELAYKKAKVSFEKGENITFEELKKQFKNV